MNRQELNEYIDNKWQTCTLGEKMIIDKVFSLNVIYCYRLALEQDYEQVEDVLDMFTYNHPEKMNAYAVQKRINELIAQCDVIINTPEAYD